jgi:hypothetical protein
MARIRECEPFSHGNLDEGSSTRSLLIEAATDFTPPLSSEPRREKEKCSGIRHTSLYVVYDK